MNISESDYKDLIRYAKNITVDNYIIVPEDAVNDCLLKMIEDGIEYKKDPFKALLRNYILYNTLTIGNSVNKNRLNRDLEHYCPCCKQSLPVALFRVLHNKKNGVTSLASYCKPCYLIKSNGYRKKKEENPEYKKGRKEYQAAWRKKNPNKWREIWQRSEANKKNPQP
jgi:hypothetical protein